MGNKKSNVPSYLYYDDSFSKWGMLTANLLTAPQFIALPNSVRNFYLVCAIHKQTVEQSYCLYNALKEYHELLGKEISDFDLRVMAGQEKRSKVKSPYFVIPQSQLEQYGYTQASNVTRMKKALIEAKFIKVFANEKKHSTSGGQGCNQDFSKRVTIYQFINDWKKEE